MVNATWQEWRQWLEEGYTMMPYVQRFPKAAPSVASWQGVWRHASPHAFVLESGKDGRYHYLGLQPRSTIKGKGHQAEITDAIHQKRSLRTGSPLKLVKEWADTYRSPRRAGWPKFIGGITGYWAYDIVRHFEPLPTLASEDEAWPDYYFMMVDELWIVDALTDDLYCCLHVPVDELPDLSSDADRQKWKLAYQRAAEKAQDMKARWDTWMKDAEAAKQAQNRKQKYEADYRHSLQEIEIESIQDIQIDFPKKDFIDAVKRIQEYIRDGDVFQVNLSTRQQRTLRTAGEEIYEWLRLCNPAPYMGYLRFPEFELVSASPELLVKLEGEKLSTKPIAGTRRRGENSAEDRELAQELLSNEKERAEHIMLVDLERNDMGRVCQYGTIKLKDLMTVEYYSHVMHLVSEIEGQLFKGKDAFDVIEAVFPGGTITGAPKIRTMEIIEELEPIRRGPYTGSFGWIDFNGNCEFNIMIRTLVVNEEGRGYVQAGAGIVSDSDPEKEYIESLNKAKALWKAVQYSELWKMEGLR